MKKFSKVTAREVLENFQSDSEYGLSNAAISSLKKIHGTNKIAEEEKVIKLISYHNTSTSKPLYSYRSIFFYDMLNILKIL